MCICFIDKLNMVSIHALLLFKTIPTLIPGDQAEHPPPSHSHHVSVCFSIQPFKTLTPSDIYPKIAVHVPHISVLASHLLLYY